jgi:hypothetical protein
MEACVNSHGRSRLCEPGSSSYPDQATGVRAPGTIQTPDSIFTNPGGGSLSMPMALEQSTSMFGTNTCEPTSEVVVPICRGLQEVELCKHV